MGFNIIFGNNVGHVGEDIGCFFSSFMVRFPLLQNALSSIDSCRSRCVVHVVPPYKNVFILLYFVLLLASLVFIFARIRVERIAVVFIPPVHGRTMVCRAFTKYGYIIDFGKSSHIFPRFFFCTDTINRSIINIFRKSIVSKMSAHQPRDFVFFLAGSLLFLSLDTSQKIIRWSLNLKRSLTFQ